MVEPGAGRVRLPGGSPSKPVRVGPYAAAFAAALRQRLAYPGELVLGYTFLVVVFFVFVHLWPAAYAGRDAVAGLTLAQLLTYLVVTEALVTAPRVWTAVQHEVRTGDVVVAWSRPVAYDLWHLATYLGEAAITVPAALAVGGTMVYLQLGHLAAYPAALPGGLLCLVLALLMNFYVELLVGLSAFWSEDAGAWQLLMAMARLLAGGVLLPLEMLPAPVAAALRWLPFPYMVYAPARMLVSPDPRAALGVLPQQLAWLLALALAARGLLAAARRRVSVHGG